jgi:hypothetical protein
MVHEKLQGPQPASPGPDPAHGCWEVREAIADMWLGRLGRKGRMCRTVPISSEL